MYIIKNFSHRIICCFLRFFNWQYENKKRIRLSIKKHLFARCEKRCFLAKKSNYFLLLVFVLLEVVFFVVEVEELVEQDFLQQDFLLVEEQEDVQE